MLNPKVVSRTLNVKSYITCQTLTVNITELIQTSPGFLKNRGDNFLVQVLRELTRKSSFLGSLLVNRKGLMREVAIGSHSGHGSHKAVKYKIFDDRRKIATKTPALDMVRPDFRMLRELVSKVLCKIAFEGMELHQC